MKKELFIMVGVTHIIYGFPTKKSASTFLKENKEKLIRLGELEDYGKEDLKDVLKVAPASELEAIAVEVFWDQRNGNTAYEPEWIDCDLGDVMFE